MSKKKGLLRFLRDRELGKNVSVDSPSNISQAIAEEKSTIPIVNKVIAYKFNQFNDAVADFIKPAMYFFPLMTRYYRILMYVGSHGREGALSHPWEKIIVYFLALTLTMYTIFIRKSGMPTPENMVCQMPTLKLFLATPMRIIP